jgi:predicted adenylyl cyclase CyaB
MASNIEIKARVESRAGCEGLVKTLADSGPIGIFQDDTFFNCLTGRLKLRDFGDGTAELIFYRRTDQDGPKQSFYEIAPCPDPDAMRLVLEQAYGSCGRVIKKRTLYLVGRTRIHLDQVEGLGDFLELEVVLAGGEDPAVGEAEAQALMRQLGIERSDLVEGAYVDLFGN